MTYYLLKVEQAGARSYVAAEQAKHMIDAVSLSDAKTQADWIIDDQYKGGGSATMKLIDITGVVATRKGEGTWDA